MLINYWGGCNMLFSKKMIVIFAASYYIPILKKLMFMKKFLVLLLPLAIAACQFDYPSTVEVIAPTSLSSLATDVIGDSIYIGSNQLENLLGSPFSPLSATSRGSLIEMDTITDSKGNPLIYVINYGSNSGFMLVSAVKTAYPILAYNRKGRYDVKHLNPGAKFVLENIKNNVEATIQIRNEEILINRIIWQTVEDKQTKLSRTEDLPDDYDSWPDALKEQYQKSIEAMLAVTGSWRNDEYIPLDGGTWPNWMSESQINEIFDNAEGNVYIQFMSRYKQLSAARLETKVLVDDEKANTVLCTWHQLSPYNQSYPLLSNGFKAYAGCGPVAAGQIMRYYQWPPNYNWADMPYSYGTKTTSDFLYDIAEAAHASYEIDGTGVFISDINNVFISKGYRTSGVNKLDKRSQLGDCATNPVYVRGRAFDASSNDYVNHAFVACGSSSFLYQPVVTLYTIVRPGVFEKIFQITGSSYGNSKDTYINWGYGGSGNGFYNFNYYKYGNLVYNNNLYYVIPIPDK